MRAWAVSNSLSDLATVVIGDLVLVADQGDDARNEQLARLAFESAESSRSLRCLSTPEQAPQRPAL